MRTVDVRLTVRVLWALIGSLFTVAVIHAAFIMELPYFAIAPGQAHAVNALIQVPKDVAHPPQGAFLLTTVSLSKVRGIEAVAGWLDPDTDVIPEERILGPTPRRDFRRQNIQQMDDSIQRAEVVALRALGYPVTERGEGGLVASVAEDSPSDGVLHAGDVITAIDQKPVRLGSDVVAALSTRKYGESVRLDVRTGEQPARSVTIKLGGSNENKTECSTDEAHTGRGCLGVSLGTFRHQFDRPVQIAVDARGIGGPSAGLAFVLGIMDQLRPGELTAGKKVAVTGTIDYDGTVGDVGGVVQKTAVVRDAGADVFLVPPGEYDQAKSHAGDKLQVIRVATLAEALEALKKLGGTI